LILKYNEKRFSLKEFSLNRFSIATVLARPRAETVVLFFFGLISVGQIDLPKLARFRYSPFVNDCRP